jgi:hypothetical protein
MKKIVQVCSNSFFFSNCFGLIFAEGKQQRTDMEHKKEQKYHSSSERKGEELERSYSKSRHHSRRQADGGTEHSVKETSVPEIRVSRSSTVLGLSTPSTSQASIHQFSRLSFHWLHVF